MHKGIEIEIINSPTEIFVGKLEVNQDLAQQVGLSDSVLLFVFRRGLVRISAEKQLF
jgi:hypothetical protein